MRAQASIFSTGSTSTELAPAFFRLSSVSQNTFSRHTACTATRSPMPSSGMIVGASLPGQQLADRGQRRARRVQHDVLALLDLLDAVDAHQQPLDPVVLLGGSGTGVRISTAWLSSTVSTSRR